ncbi:MAG TPA: hypothetical protein VGL00_10605, partial [Terracidiphilus sp.]
MDIIAGDHLISHTVTRAVPSAQRGLTVFPNWDDNPTPGKETQFLERAVELTKRDNVSFSWIEMSMRVSLWSYIVSTAFVIGTTASAQSSNYHLEYVRNGETTDIVLVNDSSKAIEAYSLVQRCP